jgi:two-component system chemotaxis response regulator CheB
MFSSLTGRGSQVAIEALTSGASDCMLKPDASGDRAANLAQLKSELVPRLKALGARPEPRSRPEARPVEPPRIEPSRPAPRATPPVRLLRHRAVRVVAVGASTGGPDALVTLLSALPARFTTPIVIVQHIPAGFTRSLCERLAVAARRPVVEAFHDLPLTPGAVVIAPSDAHLEVVTASDDRLHCRLNRAAAINNVRPAVDVLFHSLTCAPASSVVAVVLTGMGKDGAAGAAALARAGADVIAQDEASSVVWGMPGAVARDGSAQMIAPLPRIALALRDIERTQSVPIPVLHGVT